MPPTSGLAGLSPERWCLKAASTRNYPGFFRGPLVRVGSRAGGNLTLAGPGASTGRIQIQALKAGSSAVSRCWSYDTFSPGRSSVPCPNR